MSGQLLGTTTATLKKYLQATYFLLSPRSSHLFSDFQPHTSFLQSRRGQKEYPHETFQLHNYDLIDGDSSYSCWVWSVIYKESRIIFCFIMVNCY